MVGSEGLEPPTSCL